MIYDSLIFDLDGTLWDSCQLVASARNRIVKKLGLPLQEFTATDVKAAMGLTTIEVYERSFSALPLERYMEIRPVMGDEIARLILKGEGELYPAVSETLETLARSRPLFIVSNCSVKYLEAFLQWSKLGHCFKECVCHGQNGLAKADNIRKVVSDHRLMKPLYIGDTEWDQSASNQAGVDYLHADYGFGKAIGPCQHIEKFQELIEVVNA